MAPPRPIYRVKNSANERERERERERMVDQFHAAKWESVVRVAEDSVGHQLPAMVGYAQRLACE